VSENHFITEGRGSEEIVAELDREARAREAQFLDGLAARLNRARVKAAPEHPFRGAPDFWQVYQRPHDERVELFMTNWQNLGGVAKRFADRQALAAYIVEEAERLQARYLLRWDHPLLAALGLEERLQGECWDGAEMIVWNATTQDPLAKAAGADIGLVVAEAAIAHTGTVVTVSSEGQGRSVSLLPTAMMAVVRAADVKTRMGEVMRGLHERYGVNLPAGVHFISGPSRSADIENDLTIGVHGPGVVYALVLDEE
jgi:L-lactate dehydrogenase complex protein LldG